VCKQAVKSPVWLVAAPFVEADYGSMNYQSREQMRFVLMEVVFLKKRLRIPKKETGHRRGKRPKRILPQCSAVLSRLSAVWTHGWILVSVLLAQALPCQFRVGLHGRLRD
jgi:hypothetical protein